MIMIYYDLHLSMIKKEEKNKVQISLRVDEELKNQLERLAEADGRTLNSYVANELKKLLNN